jgi:thiol-disulfide isomerase/thioredoxin
VTPRIAIVAGLGSGAAVAILVLVAFAALVPAPKAAVPSGSPSPTLASSPTAGAPTGSPAAPTSGPSLIVAGFHVGEAAPPLKVPQLGGGEIDLANLAGQPLWINFMATYSPTSHDEFALMNSFAERYADTSLVVIAIDVGEDESTTADFAVATNAHFPIGLDEDRAAQTAWDAPVLPVHFWIDKDGIIRAGSFGGLDGAAMAARLQLILPGVAVTP